jgi:hypothetical protein
MFKHLRRWHFDVAIFLGLTVFAWAYWNSVARPIWQQPLCDPSQLKLTQSQLLKFSSDQQCLSVFIEGNEVGTGKTIRRIEHRRTSDGSVMKQLPLQQPMGLKEDGENVKSIEYFVYEPWVAVQWTTENNKSYASFYSPDDGKILDADSGAKNGFDPVSEKLEGHLFVPGKHLFKNGHALALRVTLNRGLPPIPSYLVDLHTTIVLKTFTSPFGHAKYGTLTPDGNHYILCWASSGAYEIEVFQTDTWASTGRSKSHKGYLSNLVFLDDRRFVVADTVIPRPAMQYPYFRITCYHLDTNGTLTPDISHSLHDMTSTNRLFVEPPVLIENTIEQNAPFDFPLRTLEQWLAKIGLRRNYSQRVSYLISDMTSGQPLRTIHNLPPGNILANPDWSLLFYLPNNQFGVSDTLVCYPVQSVAWNRTLSWLQWLSWLLVIPWPLRYFVRKPTIAPM